MRWIRYVYLLMVVVFLVGCGKELEEPSIKRQDPRVFKGDFEFTESEGTVKEPVTGGEHLLLSGELSKNRYETTIGEFGIELTKVYRGEAAKYRLPKEEMEKKLPKGREWIMVVLDVYNYENDEGRLEFSVGELGLYSKKGNNIKSVDVGREDSPERVSIYNGDVKQVVIVGTVKKKTGDILVGVNKVLNEFSLDEEEVTEEDIEEDSEDVTESDKEEEESKDKGKEKEEEPEEQEELIKYLSTEGIITYTSFYEDDGDEEVEVEEEAKEEKEGKEKSEK